MDKVHFLTELSKCNARFNELKAKEMEGHSQNRAYEMHRLIGSITVWNSLCETMGASLEEIGQALDGKYHCLIGGRDDKVFS